MNNENETRRRNLKKIADQFETQKDLADLLGRTPGYINQLLIGTRNIGEKTARRIEEKLTLNKYQLDTTTNENKTKKYNSINNISHSMLDIRASYDTENITQIINKFTSEDIDTLAKFIKKHLKNANEKTAQKETPLK